MNGIEFLEAGDGHRTRTARRVLLTAYADTDAAIDAINVVDLDHYLLKPWDPPEEKLYPVIDALLEPWQAADHAAGAARPRWSGTAGRRGRREVREFLARNQVAYRWYDVATSRTGSGCWPRPGADGLTAAGGDHRRTARRWSSRPTPSWPARSGLATTPAQDFYDLVVIGGGPAGPGRRGLRRVRGAAHRAGRAHGHRRPGRAELPDRELPRLPGRGVRRAADRRGPGGRRRKFGAEVLTTREVTGLEVNGAGADRPLRRRRGRSARTPSSWPPGSPTGS